MGNGWRTDPSATACGNCLFAICRIIRKHRSRMFPLARRLSGCIGNRRLGGTEITVAFRPAVSSEYRFLAAVKVLVADQVKTPRLDCSKRGVPNSQPQVNAAQITGMCRNRMAIHHWRRSCSAGRSRLRRLRHCTEYCQHCCQSGSKCCRCCLSVYPD